MSQLSQGLPGEGLAKVPDICNTSRLDSLLCFVIDKRLVLIASQQIFNPTN
jgi:hypothetical protein